MHFAKTNNFSSWKETIFGSFAIILFLAVFYFLPYKTNIGTVAFLQISTKYFFLFLLCPLLFVKFILKKDFKDFGFNMGNKKIGFIWGGITLVFCLILSYILINYTGFLKPYGASLAIPTKFSLFLLFELVLFNIPFFFHEYFFKGFVLSVFSEKFLYGAIFIQAAPVVIPQIISAKSTWEIIPAILVSIFGGFVSYKSKSFFYSYLMGLLYFVILHSYIISLIKK